MSTLPTGEAKARMVRQMFDRIAPRYDLVNRVMTLGLDVRWRKRTVTELRLAPGSRVLDLACGTGDLCRELARADLRPVGVDFAEAMLRAARTSAPLVHADILRLPFDDASVDGVTCGFALRNVADLRELFAEMARVVRPGGRFALLEVSEPPGGAMRALHGFYFNRVVPVIGGMLSDAQAYRYLPDSVAYLPSAPELTRMLLDAGFGTTARTRLTAGAAQLFAGTRT